MAQSLRGHYAGFVSRLVAYMLDAVVISLVLAAAVWFINTVSSVLSKQDIIRIPVFSNSTQFILSTAFITLFIILYFSFFWSVAGRTPGKAFMGLRVVTTDGRSMTFLRALVRVGGYIVSTAVFYVGFLWILVDNRRQAWHDKFARTYVIYDWDARHGGQYLTAALQRWGPGNQDSEWP